MILDTRNSMLVTRNYPALPTAPRLRGLTTKRMTQDKFSDRKNHIIAAVVIIGVLYVARLFYLQVIDTSYKASANRNVLRYETQYPQRGLIYDRNGNLLVYNEIVYDLMVIPVQVEDPDTTELCSVLGIDRTGFEQRILNAKKYSSMLPSVFEKQISKETFAYIEEKLYKYKGFFIQPRTLRKYPKAVGAHLLGYVGEVTQNDIDKDPYYKQGDYIGVSGLESTYETELRGIKGLKIKMVDVHNRYVGMFEDGKYDTSAIGGLNLYTGIDIELQEYGEKLMQNKLGSIVAVEPETGAILCFVSSPTYDPNLLVGRVRGKNFKELSSNKHKPLLNRVTQGQYPPGSTFKMANSSVALQLGVMNASTMFSCQGVASTPIRCTHSHASPLNIYTAIQQSCNPFQYQAFRAVLNDKNYKTIKERYDVWRFHIMSLGFGKAFNTDIAYEKSGNVPTSDYFDKLYGKDRWNSLTIRSLSIGQGEILATPLQLVNYAAIVANEGFYYPPHIVEAVGNRENKTQYTTQKTYTSISSANTVIMKDCMAEVFEAGTARAYATSKFTQAGKTGTADNPHGKPHSTFVAFAPVENPKIAICVVVENSGYGSTWAAPIASLMMEKYITGDISRPEIEERMLNSNLIGND